MSPVPAANILDVRRRAACAAPGASDLRDQILAGLARPAGVRTLPTMLLYDEHGLRLYDDITTQAPEYYLFSAEEEILRTHAHDIVRAMHAGAAPDAPVGEEVVLELGAGALRKTSLVLHALAQLVPAPMASPPITYYALDLEERELARTLAQLDASAVGPALKGKVDPRGMLGTYDDGIAFVADGGLRGRADIPARLASAAFRREDSPASSASQPSACASRSRSPAHSAAQSTAPSTPAGAHPPLHVLFLGSSLGNFSRGADAAFLRALPLRAGAGDTLLLGLDHDNDAGKIVSAYNDPKGVTRAFIMNGLRVAGRALGDEGLFEEDKWEYVNMYNEENRRHEAYYKSKGDQTVRDPASGAEFPFVEDELVQVEVSTKFSDRDAHALFADANLRPIQRWTDAAGQYSLWLLERPPFAFPLLTSPSSTSAAADTAVAARPSPFGVPTVAEWQALWAAWDFITLRMIPPGMLFEKPIDLRHICLFYMGHIPTFLDIHLARLLKEKHTEPESFKTIFERGIDPNVDDPTQCHDHSEVPEHEDEWPTLETILDFTSRVRARLLALYGALASGARPPSRTIARVLFMTYEHEAFHAETLLYMLLQSAGRGPGGTVPPPDFTPPPWASLSAGWDSAPAPSSARVALGPATVALGHDDVEADDGGAHAAVEGHAFGWDNESPRREVQVAPFRIEWRPVSNGEFLAFYEGKGKDQVALPKSWVAVDGEMHVRTLYGPVPMRHARHWPVVADYESLSKYAALKGGRLPTEAELRLFLDKFESGYEGGANVGFRNWHPVPATAGAGRDGGRGHNGGVWEWTSTQLAAHEGFVPSKLYPGYSADFFDGCHQVVIGGSYATIPRLAGRRTVRNWYQANYGYAWVGGRVAYDGAGEEQK